MVYRLQGSECLEILLPTLQYFRRQLGCPVNYPVSFTAMLPHAMLATLEIYDLRKFEKNGE